MNRRRRGPEGGQARVAIISSRRAPLSAGEIVDGGSLNVYRILEALIGIGCSVDVFTRSNNGSESVKNTRFGRLIYVPFTPSATLRVLCRDFDEGQSFVANLLSSRHFALPSYECLHTHHWASTIGLPEAIGKGQRLLHTPHLLACDKALHNQLDLPPKVRAAEEATLRRANAIFALSASEANSCVDTYGIDRRKVIEAPNGIDSSFFHVKSRGRRANRPVAIMGIGRICRQKGIDVLIEAISRLTESGMPVHLRWIGADYREAEFQAVRSGCDALSRTCVTFVPGVSRNGLLRHFREADIYVQPSRYESQGVALLEAMAASKPVVASSLPATQEFVKAGVNGLLVKAGDAVELTGAIESLVRNPHHAAELGQHARSSVTAFTWDRMLDRVVPRLMATA